MIWFERATFLALLGSALVEDDGVHPAEAIVVLAGDQTGNRIRKAAQLAQAGYAPIILVSGPRALVGHESDMAIQYAENLGFSRTLFEAVPHNQTSTRAETAFIGKYLRRRGIHRILLVTSSYHTRRAAYLMRLQDPRLQVDVVAAPDPDFTPDGWWKSREGQKTFLLECAKTVATRLGD
jgi:uncharacterized SAM-binding protein YcdF (DUF218 family)